MGKIISGIVIIVLGVSGHFVLKGTNSSTALIFVGLAVFIIGIFQVINKYNDEDVEFETNASEKSKQIPHSDFLTHPKKQKFQLEIDIDNVTKEQVQNMHKSEAIAFLREKYSLTIKEAKIIINNITESN